VIPVKGDDAIQVTAPAAPRRLLVRLPNWIGDVAMATPVLRALRLAFPAARIDWLLKSYLVELISGCGWYDELLLLEGGDGTGRAENRFQLSRRLRRRRYDTAFLFPNSFGSLVPIYLAGIPRRIGYNRYSRGWMLTEAAAPPRDRLGKIVPEPMPPYYARLLRRLGVSGIDLRLSLPYDESRDAELDRLVFQGNGPDPALPVVCFHPGAAYGSAKCWPPEYFAELGDRILDAFRVNLVITLGPAESALEPLIAGAMTNRAHFLKLPLGLLTPLFRRIRLLVTNDTGPRHIGVAMDRRMVVLFGPSDIRFTKFNLEKTALVIRDDLPCIPCGRRVCPLGHHNCMVGVPVDTVYDHARRILLDPADGPVEPRS
jgi:heptosyltransferase-2